MGSFRSLRMGSFRRWRMGSFRTPESGFVPQAESGFVPQAESGFVPQAENGFVPLRAMDLNDSSLGRGFLPRLRDSSGRRECPPHRPPSPIFRRRGIPRGEDGFVPPPRDGFASDRRDGFVPSLRARSRLDPRSDGAGRCATDRGRTIGGGSLGGLAVVVKSGAGSGPSAEIIFVPGDDEPASARIPEIRSRFQRSWPTGRVGRGKRPTIEPHRSSPVRTRRDRATMKEDRKGSQAGRRRRSRPAPLDGGPRSSAHPTSSKIRSRRSVVGWVSLGEAHPTRVAGPSRRQNALRLSSRSVTGPSFSNSTFMSARKVPVSTGRPSPRRASANRR